MWLFLITTLPAENATIRQRVWRALKSSGAAVLRDGVYLMPETPACRSTFESIAGEVRAGKGTAWVARAEEPGAGNFKALFDRRDDYAVLQRDIAVLSPALQSASVESATNSLKQLRKLRKAFAAIVATDFFPEAPRKQTEAALDALERSAARILSPHEPQPAGGHIARLSRDDFQRRVWATRRRPWVDRLASAWLITRFVDPKARFLWLKQPADCPEDAIGFDFDGAMFTHVGERVTFEVLMASFGLENAALQRLAELVHFLDVGGVPPAEAAGIESVLAGLRTRSQDDDSLLEAGSNIFDSLYASFSTEADV